jgi:high-affinity Fe2+/Pb2+ permease
MEILMGIFFVLISLGLLLYAGLWLLFLGWRREVDGWHKERKMPWALHSGSEWRNTTNAKSYEDGQVTFYPIEDRYNSSKE